MLKRLLHINEIIRIYLLRKGKKIRIGVMRTIFRTTCGNSRRRGSRNFAKRRIKSEGSTARRAAGDKDGKNGEKREKKVNGDGEERKSEE